MARNKAVKKKSKAKASAKGKAEDGVKWREQLSRLGLKIVHVTADGNCFFRAIADQLEGYEEEHLKYRQMVVDYMEEHRQDFEPFVEDEVPFDEYCKGMRENGTWAGHMELQAASLVTRTNICIHKIMSPRWQIRNFEKAGTTTLHLSYHDCEHYNSVRGMDDDGMGPANPIVIQGDNNLQIGSKEQKGFPSNATSKGLPDEDSVKVAMVGSGCKDHTKVQEVLHEVRGDIDAAIEYLITERRIGDTLGTQDASPAIEINGRTETSSAQSVELGSAEMHHSDIEASSDDDSDKCNVNKLTKDAKAKSQKVARNKPCPCGSKKKYKNCCGAVRHKTVARIVTGGKEVLSNKARKIRSRSDKVLSQRKPSSPLPEHNTDFDMGSLCI